ncbi:hypothetical protein CSUB01_09149 [Colletotrichum sublineola]|uniref:Uncharacterized protein n=1 Tax=Colletotrichum sublineola TaxID=1173701 RepID=A0A066XCN2_COLSU|nr:hypothetical protein CSUB01_09149 [Colletotrichum sublineola]
MQLHAGQLITITTTSPSSSSISLSHSLSHSPNHTLPIHLSTLSSSLFPPLLLLVPPQPNHSPLTQYIFSIHPTHTPTPLLTPPSTSKTHAHTHTYHTSIIIIAKFTPPTLSLPSILYPANYNVPPPPPPSSNTLHPSSSPIPARLACSVLPVPPTLPARCGDAAKPHFHDWTFVALLILSTSLNHWPRAVRLPISSHDRLPIRSHNLPVPLTCLASPRLAFQVNLETYCSPTSLESHNRDHPPEKQEPQRKKQKNNNHHRRVYCFADRTSQQTSCLVLRACSSPRNIIPAEFPPSSFRGPLDAPQRQENEAAPPIPHPSLHTSPTRGCRARTSVLTRNGPGISHPAPS